MAHSGECMVVSNKVFVVAAALATALVAGTATALVKSIGIKPE